MQDTCSGIYSLVLGIASFMGNIHWVHRGAIESKKVKAS